MTGGSRLSTRLAGAIGALGEELTRPVGHLLDEIPGQRRALEKTGHRPWPVQERPWLMGQTWRDLLFAHWRVDSDELRAHVPAPLELDVYEGEAWLGLTPFEVTGLRPRGAPPPPIVSRFAELNVRTYVTWRGRPGIFFFSLDASSAAAVVAARRGFLLPYFRASAAIDRRGQSLRFELTRLGARGEAPIEWRGVYRPSGPYLPLRDGSLERWLTERYCLYVVEGGRVLRGDIHHRPWPLRQARAEIEANSMTRTLGIELDGEPLLHFGARQDTLFWRLQDAGRDAMVGSPA